MRPRPRERGACPSSTRTSRPASGSQRPGQILRRPYPGPRRYRGLAPGCNICRGRRSALDDCLGDRSATSTVARRTGAQGHEADRRQTQAHPAQPATDQRQGVVQPSPARRMGQRPALPQRELPTPGLALICYTPCTEADPSQPRHQPVRSGQRGSRHSGRCATALQNGQIGARLVHLLRDRGRWQQCQTHLALTMRQPPDDPKVVKQHWTTV